MHAPVAPQRQSHAAHGSDGNRAAAVAIHLKRRGPRPVGAERRVKDITIRRLAEFELPQFRQPGDGREVSDLRRIDFQFLEVG